VEDSVKQFLISRIEGIRIESDRKSVLEELELAARNLIPEDFEGMRWVLDQIQEITSRDLSKQE